MSDDNPVDVFWAFSLSAYKRPDVAAACLDLQDRAGLDVNLLLHILWLARTGRGPLNEQGWRDRMTLIEPWMQFAVRPLRNIRRDLKRPDNAPVAAADRETVRQSIVHAELAAEKVVQTLLAAAAPPAGDDSKGGGTAAARSMLRAYFAAAGRMPDRMDEAALGTLLTVLASGD